MTCWPGWRPEYRERLEELDAYFAAHRFVRIQNRPAFAEEFPVLEGLSHVRNLVLTMYSIKNLSGNAILEAGIENTTYTHEKLALALLYRKTDLTAAFLRIE